MSMPEIKTTLWLENCSHAGVVEVMVASLISPLRSECISVAAVLSVRS